jgi:hypothetical protein
MVEFPREGNKMLIISTDKNGETNERLLKLKVTSTRKIANSNSRGWIL